MIRLVNLCKSYYIDGRETVVADNINATLPGNTSIALLGQNGTGKSSLLRMIAGTMDTSSGEIHTEGTVSWPVGFGGNFHPDLSGAQNARFVARVYGVDTEELVAYAAEFADLGMHMDMPFRTYSAGMRSRLAFGVSMAIDFDTYLVDEVTSVGDAAFRKKSAEVFKERVKTRGAIVVSHSMPVIRNLCTAGMLLNNGTLHYFDKVEDAIQAYNALLEV